ncbi:MAG: hypothetical protein H6624_16775 [Bdellovibrionaceae bacterium]|nr:hypothetical protein [Bdellovibrionales bacterium]MCB9086000.1 hypothetical protein [Pseudobdellovibrionaceae bacterium]
MDGTNNIKSTKKVEKSKAQGKSITKEANERLKQIKDEINQGGGTKNKYNEGDILSFAVMNFPKELISTLRSQRISEGLKEALGEVCQEFGVSGAEAELETFLSKKLTTRFKGSKKSKPENKTLDQNSIQQETK